MRVLLLILAVGNIFGGGMNLALWIEKKLTMSLVAFFVGVIVGVALIIRVVYFMS